MKKSMLSEYANDTPPVGMSNLLTLKGFNLDDLPFTRSSSQLQLQLHNSFFERETRPLLWFLTTHLHTKMAAC